MFAELGEVFTASETATPYRTGFQRSPEMAALTGRIDGGQGFFSALAEVVAVPGSQLGAYLFGGRRATFDSLTGCVRVVEATRQLYLGSFDEAPLTITDATSPMTAFLVLTDFATASVYVWRDGHWGKSISSFSASELHEEIQFCGSLWASLHPTHYGIGTRSQSFVLPVQSSGPLFLDGRSRDDSDIEASALRRLEHLALDGEELVSLSSLQESLAGDQGGPQLLQVHDSSNYRLRRYDPGRSPVYDFGAPSGAPKRQEFVTSYLSDGEEREFHREFIVDNPDLRRTRADASRAIWDVLHMLSIRRTKLFRLEFATRVYTILLPHAIVHQENSPETAFLLIPCLTLYRLPGRSSFRRTMTLTTIVSPIEQEETQVSCDSGVIRSRQASLGELRSMMRELKTPIPAEGSLGSKTRYHVEGPMAERLNLSGDVLALPEFLELISRSLLRSVLSRRRRGTARPRDQITESQIEATTFASAMESQLGCLLLQVEWHAPVPYNQPWEQWLSLGSHRPLERNLFKTIWYEDFLDPQSGYASEHAIDLKRLNIGNTLGADMTGMTLYDPRQELKVILYPSALEMYPDYSLVRWMAWSLFVDSALATLPTMIASFYSDLGSRGDLEGILRTLDKMIADFVEFYDLDIREYVYRREYELLRDLMRVDDDYRLLLAKFESAKEDASLREQRLINRLLVAFTVATFTATAVSTLASTESWPAQSYVVVLVLVTVLATYSSYLLFDPVRRRFDRSKSSHTREPMRWRKHARK